MSMNPALPLASSSGRLNELEAISKRLTNQLNASSSPGRRYNLRRELKAITSRIDQISKELIEPISRDSSSPSVHSPRSPSPDRPQSAERSRENSPSPIRAPRSPSPERPQPEQPGPNGFVLPERPDRTDQIPRNHFDSNEDQREPQQPPRISDNNQNLNSRQPGSNGFVLLNRTESGYTQFEPFDGLMFRLKKAASLLSPASDKPKSKTPEVNTPAQPITIATPPPVLSLPAPPVPVIPNIADVHARDFSVSYSYSPSGANHSKRKATRLVKSIPGKEADLNVKKDEFHASRNALNDAKAKLSPKDTVAERIAKLEAIDRCLNDAISKAESYRDAAGATRRITDHDHREFYKDQGIIGDRGSDSIRKFSHDARDARNDLKDQILPTLKDQQAEIQKQIQATKGIQKTNKQISNPPKSSKEPQKKPDDSKEKALKGTLEAFDNYRSYSFLIEALQLLTSESIGSVVLKPVYKAAPTAFKTANFSLQILMNPSVLKRILPALMSTPYQKELRALIDQNTPADWINITQLALKLMPYVHQGIKARFPAGHAMRKASRLALKGSNLAQIGFNFWWLSQATKRYYTDYQSGQLKAYDYLMRLPLAALTGFSIAAPFLGVKGKGRLLSPNYHALLDVFHTRRFTATLALCDLYDRYRPLKSKDNKTNGAEKAASIALMAFLAYQGLMSFFETKSEILMQDMEEKLNENRFSDAKASLSRARLNENEKNDYASAIGYIEKLESNTIDAASYPLVENFCEELANSQDGKRQRLANRLRFRLAHHYKTINRFEKAKKVILEMDDTFPPVHLFLASLVLHQDPKAVNAHVEHLLSAKAAFTVLKNELLNDEAEDEQIAQVLNEIDAIGRSLAQVKQWQKDAFDDLIKQLNRFLDWAKIEHDRAESQLPFTLESRKAFQEKVWNLVKEQLTPFEKSLPADQMASLCDQALNFLKNLKA